MYPHKTGRTSSHPLAEYLRAYFTHLQSMPSQGNLKQNVFIGQMPFRLSKQHCQQQVSWGVSNVLGYMHRISAAGSSNY